MERIPTLLMTLDLGELFQSGNQNNSLTFIKKYLKLSVTMGYRKTLILFVCFITYLCLGALAFIAIEKGFHSPLQALTNFNEVFDDFVREHSSCGVTRESLTTFIRDHGQLAQDRGVFRFDVDPSKGVQNEWSMANALVFTTEIVTTIGHGTVTPRTLTGRLFCVVYALFGLPLCCIMLAAVGDAVLILADKIDSSLRRRLRFSLLVNVARLSIIVLVFWSVLVTFPTLIYTTTEGWDWVKAQYYSFISMSTIGFGDLTVSIRRHSDSEMKDLCYKVGTSANCFLTLGIVSAVFKVLFRWHRNHIQQTRDRFRSWRQRTSVFKRRTSNIQCSTINSEHTVHTTTLD